MTGFAGFSWPFMSILSWPLTIITTNIEFSRWVNVFYDEQMTGAQHSYLKTLSDEAGEQFDQNLTKAEASKRIEELQQKTGRGLNR